MEQRSLATATFVYQIDELFDSFNGSRITAPDGKELKCCISEQSPHMSYWNKAFNMIKNWNFRRITKKGNVMSGKPPSQIGWMVTIRAIKGIWNYLKNKGFTNLRPRSLNQDALENLFGAVRSGCGSGDNPTTFQFIGSLKTQILNGLTSQSLSGTNCEEDDHHLLSNLTSFLNVTEEDQQLERGDHIKGLRPFETSGDKVVNDIINAVSEGNIETFSVAYVSGFIAKRLLKEVDCQLCNELLSSLPDDLHNTYITFREWTEEARKLIYPSENLVVTVGHAITILEKLLSNFDGRPGVEKFAVQHIREEVQFSWLTCSAHNEIIIENLVKAVCRIGIPWWCKRKNCERREQKKDIRASKRKISKLQHH